MGTCCSAKEEENKNRNYLNNNQGRRKIKDISDISIESGDVRDPRLTILKNGNTKEIQNMLQQTKSKGEINECVFRNNNRTMLLEAIEICNDVNIIEMIIRNGGDVNKEEQDTGNTPLFLAAKNLKTDFVQLILKYNPNLLHKNFKRQNILEYLESFEDNPNMDRNKYNTIYSIIKKEFYGNDY